LLSAQDANTECVTSKTTEGTTTLVARVPIELKRELLDSAREADRSLSAETRWLLRDSLERGKSTEPKGAK